MIEMVKVRQVFEDAACFDVETKIWKEIEDKKALEKLQPGDSVGIAVGSRGIDQIDRVVNVLAQIIKEHGAIPEVFAAMGSHGGSIQGQLDVLQGLGITPEELDIPVTASSSCKQLGTAGGLPVYANSLALKYDWIVPVNRVKPHTSFSGELESGLTKMLAVGIGGPEGARIVHSGGSQAIPEMLELLGRALMERLPVLMGIALVENSSHCLEILQVCSKNEFVMVDKALLVEARKNLLVLPFDEIDVLIVNKMGKCFSGTGMDTNVIGRVGIRGVPDRGLKAGYIVVLDLAEESYGNANGIGLADITTRRLVKKINYGATLKNVLTTSFLDRAKIPVVLPNDREAIETAIGLLSKRPEELRVVQIENTLELEEFYVSPAMADNPCLETLGPVRKMEFDPEGSLTGYG